MQERPDNEKPSGATFVKDLAATGLFASDELHRILAGISNRDTDAISLAKQLTELGMLTPFQAEAVLEHRAEDLLFGNYEVLERLGAGGMGTVYKARHRRMKRVVAIKVLSRSVAADPSFVQRFQREVETVARLAHPNIVMAFDADETQAGPYLVMEFVKGKDLASKVANEGPLPVPAAIDCILQSARGLAYAHDQGIVHRDIKPANLLQDESGLVKVADLGLARFHDVRKSEEGAGALTQAGSVVGTVDYMPPEQAMDSTAIDPRADIYSLGCTLHFLLTGLPPYVTNTLMGTLLKHQGAPIPSLSAARPDVPRALEAVYERMMAKLPENRYAGMAEVVGALEILRSQFAREIRGASQGAGQGSSSLPTVIRQVKPTLTVSPPAASLPLRVVLVEPSRTQAVIVRKYLQELGIGDIQISPSGAAAFEAIRSTRTDLVISAMHLADLTGVQLARRLREDAELGGVGFILIASETDARDANAIQEIANTVLLPKPFDASGLQRALEQVQKG